MRKIFNKKIGVLFFFLICACLVNAAPVKNENDAVKLVIKSVIKHNIYGMKNVEENLMLNLVFSAI